MEGWERGDLRVNGVRLRYYRGGGGAPVVLVHGLTDRASYWDRLARALAEDYAVVLYDSRGHGESDPSPGGYTLATLAADLLALGRALGLERPAVIGHSMGGSTAALAAAETPGMFRRVVLEDPVWSSTVRQPSDLEATRDGWRADLLALKQLDRETLMARVRGESPGWADEDYHAWVDSKAAVLPEALDVMPAFARDWLGDARRIDCPLLVLTGEPERGAIVDLAAERMLRDAQPQAAVVRLSGTGHQVRRERFDAYLAAVRSFLAE
jgi:N-formylmaleamate deformylase